MKPPLGSNPTLLLALWGLVIALSSVSLRMQPFDYPLSIVWLLAGGLAAAWVMVARALMDVAGGEDHLRRVLAGRTWYLGPYWWVALLALAQYLVLLWLIILRAQDSLGWFIYGQWLGTVAAGYPHWRSQWRRMQKLAQEEQARVAGSGGAAV